MQDTGAHRDTKDQFYTSPIVARDCVGKLKAIVTDGVWIEPSAGRGVFLDLVPSAIGYDIDPKDPRIQQADFLETEIPEGCVVFGNPPFGRQSSIANKFIAHAAEKASVIAFILPLSFSKPSMQRAFPLRYHLVSSTRLPSDCFVVNDNPYNVPCVFQIWQRRDMDRELPTPIVASGFAFVKKSTPYDIAFRRVGVNAGKCSLPGDVSEQSHYFIRLDDGKRAALVIAASQIHVFPTNTTGPRSLSKPEVTEFLNSTLQDATS